MNSNRKDFDSIKITHIINPHMFWFRPDSIYCSNEKYLALEDALYRHFQNAKVLINNRMQFAVGEMAAVFIDTWGKWIRVIVDKNIQMLEGKTKSVLWALDWGFPLQVDIDRLRPIPFDCAAYEPQILYYGGLNHIVPSETIFDFTIFKSIESQGNDWSELVVKEFRKLIDQASNIKFLPELDMDGHTFGRLEITTHNGILVDANDVLLQISGVMEIDGKIQFMSAVQNGRTTKIRRYHNNFNRLSFADLNYNMITSDALDTEYKLDYDFFANENALNMAIPSRNVVDKVVEWDRRNCEANSVVGVSENESEVGTLTLDDEAFDSISCYDALNNSGIGISSPEQDSVGIYYDDGEDECFIKKCGKLHREILKRYKIKMPREPIIPYEMALSEKISEPPSSYLQKIIETSKKLSGVNLSNLAPSTISTDCNSAIPLSKASYLEKLQEKRARALKAVESKNAASTDSSAHDRQLETVKATAKTEGVYDKDEEERREKIRQSIRGNDRNVGFYPADYPVSQITKEIVENRKSQMKHSNEQHNGKQRGTQHSNGYQSNKCNNNQYQNEQQQHFSKPRSPQHRLNRYNMKSNKNSTTAESNSEIDSEVW